jgi:hypothetical protein
MKKLLKTPSKKQLNKSMNKINQLPVRAIVLLTLIAATLFIIASKLQVENVYNCKVVALSKDMHLSGSNGNMNTTYRLIVTTDSETFICEDHLPLLGIRNSEKIYYQLKVDSVYSFKVSGFGRGFITDYRNIISITKPN